MMGLMSKKKEVIMNAVSNARQEEGITQQELADAVGITRQTVIAIEKGNYTPSVLLALKLAEKFKISVEKLFSISYE